MKSNDYIIDAMWITSQEQIPFVEEERQEMSLSPL